MIGSVHDIPGAHVDSVIVRAHAAATATEVAVIWRAPFAAKIRKVEVIPDAAATGDDTNRTNLNLLDGGTAGTGTTELGNIDYATGTDAAAGVAQDLYAPASYDAVDAGTILKLQYEKVGSGLAVGPFLVLITYEAA